MCVCCMLLVLRCCCTCDPCSYVFDVCRGSGIWHCRAVCGGIVANDAGIVCSTYNSCFLWSLCDAVLFWQLASTAVIVLASHTCCMCSCELSEASAQRLSACMSPLCCVVVWHHDANLSGQQCQPACMLVVAMSTVGCAQVLSLCAVEGWQTQRSLAWRSGSTSLAGWMMLHHHTLPYSPGPVNSTK